MSAVKGWKRESLGAQLKLIRNGYSGQQVNQFTNFPVSRIETISDGTIDLNKVGYVDFIPDSYLLQSGDILFSNINSLKHIGKIAQVSEGTKLFHGMNLLVLRPVEEVDKKFLFYKLINAKPWFEKVAAQAINQASINQGTIKELRIELPQQKPEQTKIAEILSTVDRAIEQTGALIAKQQRIKTGLMQDLLTRGIDEHGNIRSEEAHEFKDSPLGWIPGGWEVGGFENYVMGEAGIKPGPFGSSLTKDMHVEAGYRVYGQEQVIGGTLDIGDYFITGRKYSEMSGFAVEEGDVLISLVGTIGHVLIVPHRYHPGVINPRLLRFRPDPRHCVPQFLKALLLSQPVRLQLDTFATGGTMPVLSGGIIRKLRVVILGLNEQKRIIQMIASSEAALLSSSTHLAKLRSIKTALMQDLLTGKKRVTALLNDTEVVHG